MALLLCSGALEKSQRKGYMPFSFATQAAFFVLLCIFVILVIFSMFSLVTPFNGGT